MKKFFSVAVCAAMIGWAGSASAALYTDTYGSAIDLWEGQSVAINFDITDSGFKSASEIITKASLSFNFSSEDYYDETVRIYAGAYDGNKIIAEKYYDLGYSTWRGSVWEYATLNIDLATAGLLNYLQADGKFTSIVLSVNEAWPDYDSDIRLNSATLTATSAPVPEPTTMLLFGTGLAGLAAVGRRRKATKA